MVSLSPLVLIVMVHEWPLVPLFYPALISLYYNAASSVANEHDALHDWLTGLGNRELLHREATRALDALPRQGGGVAVLVLDIDRFKSVNDTLGMPPATGCCRSLLSDSWVWCDLLTLSPDSGATSSSSCCTTFPTSRRRG